MHFLYCTFCSNYFLPTLFAGLAFGIFLPHILSAILLYAILGTIGIFLWPTTVTLEMLLWLTLGLAGGFGLAYNSNTASSLPIPLRKNKTMAAVYLLEVSLFAFAFLDLDRYLPGRHWPIGVSMSFVAYTFFFIIFYNTNYRLQGVLSREKSEIEKYTRPYLLLLVVSLPFYLGAVFPLEFNVFRVFVGACIASISYNYWLFER